MESENAEVVAHLEMGDSIENTSTDMKNGSDDGEILEDLPKEVQRRLSALRKLQSQIAGLEMEFFKDMHALQVKYEDQYAPIFEKRKEIVSGKYEPKVEDCESDEDMEDLPQKTDTLVVEDGTKKEPIVGIPRFWLTVFSRVSMIAECITGDDIPILEHLIDIKGETVSDPCPGFQLEFHFSPNEFFTNAILTKTYRMKIELAPSKVSFEGPNLDEAIGCTINWNAGKDVTVKTLRRVQLRANKTKPSSPVSKTIPQESFFNFFNPPKNSSMDQLEYSRNVAQLERMADFEIGNFIIESVIPRAYLYYTGEETESDEEEESDDDEEADEGDEDSGSGFVDESGYAADLSAMQE